MIQQDENDVKDTRWQWPKMEQEGKDEEKYIKDTRQNSVKDKRKKYLQRFTLKKNKTGKRQRDEQDVKATRLKWHQR